MTSAQEKDHGFSTTTTSLKGSQIVSGSCLLRAWEICGPGKKVSMCIKRRVVAKNWKIELKEVYWGGARKTIKFMHTKVLQTVREKHVL